MHGLNLVIPEAAKTVIKPWADREDDERHADSNVDDQLIIHVPFMERVRIRSILLKLGRSLLIVMGAKLSCTEAGENPHRDILGSMPTTPT